LHLGGAWTALATWALARSGGGSCLLRIEDLDPPRVVRGAETRIREDLAWLGFDWDEPLVRQSERAPLYRDAIERLAGQGLVYPCDCSRADIERLASAPHPGEESVYPGTCRDRDPARSMKRPPSLRLRLPDEVVEYEDGILGRVRQDLAREVGDIVLERGDGVFAYHLAVVVDDLGTGITDVVRGADLVTSTPRQSWLARALGGAAPRYHHVPTVCAADGGRLQKRAPGATVRGLRDAGIAATDIVGRLAHGLGLSPTDAPRRPIDVAREAMGKPIAWRREPWRSPTEWAVSFHS
jgi:glutamyl-tRNA synthetase